MKQISWEGVNYKYKVTYKNYIPPSSKTEFFKEGNNTNDCDFFIDFDIENPYKSKEDVRKALEEAIKIMERKLEIEKGEII